MFIVEQFNAPNWAPFCSAIGEAARLARIRNPGGLIGSQQVARRRVGGEGLAGVLFQFAEKAVVAAATLSTRLGGSLIVTRRIYDVLTANKASAPPPAPPTAAAALPPPPPWRVSLANSAASHVTVATGRSPLDSA